MLGPAMAWPRKLVGVLILRDGQLHSGDAYVYYTEAMNAPPEAGGAR